jgi:hypothetical protein
MGFTAHPGYTPTVNAGTDYTLGASVSETADEYDDARPSGTYAATFTQSSTVADFGTLVMAFKAPGPETRTPTAGSAALSGASGITDLGVSTQTAVRGS